MSILPVTIVKARLLATIANGAAVSDVVALSGWTPRAIEMPAAWTAAALTLLGSHDGTNLFPIYSGGAEFSIASPVASGLYLLGLPDLAAVRFLQVRSGVIGAPVNQGAARLIGIHCLA